MLRGRGVCAGGGNVTRAGADHARVMERARKGRTEARTRVFPLPFRMIQTNNGTIFTRNKKHAYSMGNKQNGVNRRSATLLVTVPVLVASRSLPVASCPLVRDAP